MTASADRAARVAANPADEIAAFMARASFETTHPSAEDLDVLASVAAPGTRIYVSAVPSLPLENQLDVAVRIRARGFEPVPHIAVRRFAGADALDRALARLAEEAQVRCALVIGGDRPEPAGPFHAAIDVIESGLLQSRGIAEIGIAGYPEGHPRIAPRELERALSAKLEAAQQTGLAVHIVTQFAFAAEPILAWVARLRDTGIDNPVRIGLAGPTRLSTLLRYARVCGVRASAQGLARNAGLVKNLFGLTAPDEVVRPVAEQRGSLGDIAPHVYTFGGLATALRWAAAAAAGHIVLHRAGGFAVESSTG
jgi:methylenetetrahydrofolate reductase (NADPH)